MNDSPIKTALLAGAAGIGLGTLLGLWIAYDRGSLHGLGGVRVRCR